MAAEPAEPVESAKPPASRAERLRRRLVRLLPELLLIAVAVWGLEAFLARQTLGSVAPPIHGVTLDGRPFALGDFAGRPAVIHFWATWCPICGLEQGTIDGLARDLPIMTVAMGSGQAAEVRTYLREKGVDYPVINDPDGEIAARFGVTAVPASFVVDGAGRVRFVTRGYTSGWGLRLRLWVAGWLG